MVVHARTRVVVGCGLLLVVGCGLLLVAGCPKIDFRKLLIKSGVFGVENIKPD